jgi:hypothetical protein
MSTFKDTRAWRSLACLALGALAGCSHFEGYKSPDRVRPALMPELMYDGESTGLAPAVSPTARPANDVAVPAPAAASPRPVPDLQTGAPTPSPATSPAASPAARRAANLPTNEMTVAAGELAEGRARILVFPPVPARLPARPAPQRSTRPAVAAAPPAESASASRSARAMVKAPARPASAAAARSRASRQSALPIELVYEQPPPLRLATPSASRSN